VRERAGRSRTAGGAARLHLPLQRLEVAEQRGRLRLHQLRALRAHHARHLQHRRLVKLLHVPARPAGR